MATAEIKAVITADDRASDTISRFGHGVGNVAKSAAAGIAVASAAVVGFGIASVGAFMESEDAATQLNAVLKSTGGVAGVTADKANELASSLQKVTKFSDETILGGENLLLTFTKIGKDIFPQATEVMLDMSQALGQDVKSSAIQLGKALQDPILGVTALRRVGVNFSEAQQDVIKNLVETGKSAEAQAMILKELQTEFGGSAKAAGQTFSGQLEILKNTFGDTMEVIGAGVVKAIQPFVKSVADYVTNHQAEFIAGFEQLAKAVGIVFDVIKWGYDNVFIPLFNYFKDRAPAILDAFRQSWEFLKPAFEGLWTIIKTQLWPALQDLWKALEPFAPYLLGALVLSIYALITGLAVLAVILTGIVKAVTFVANAFTWLMDRASELGTTIGRMFANAVTSVVIWYVQNKAYIDGVIGALRGFVGFLGAWGGAVFHGLTWPFVTAFNMIASIINSIGSKLSSIGKLTVGGSLIPGFATGVQNFGGGLAVVGERGPELVNLPRGSDVIPNGQIANTSGSNTTININVGLMTGSAIEQRDAAMKIFENLQDIAGQRGQTVGQLIGA